jgi:hypothetical protein
MLVSFMYQFIFFAERAEGNFPSEEVQLMFPITTHI